MSDDKSMIPIPAKNQAMILPISYFTRWVFFYFSVFILLTLGFWAREMSVTSFSPESLRSFGNIDSKDSFFDLFDLSSHSTHSTNSLPAIFAFRAMAPPKARREGKEPVQPGHQHPHTNYRSILKSHDVVFAIKWSVCDATYCIAPPLKMNIATPSF